MNTPIILTKNISRFYFKAGFEVKALSGISLEIAPGEFVSIVGRSGSGKSTLLNIIGGLDRPTEGTILFDNVDLSLGNRKQLTLHRRYNVGMIFQSFNLISTRVAMDNVILPMTFTGTGKSTRKERATLLLEMLGLKERMHHKPSELSGGESQRVAIARALANNPKVLLADEPSGNLDNATASQIMDILWDLNKNKGLTIIMVTHDLQSALNSNRIIRLDDGKIVEIINQNRKQ